MKTILFLLAILSVSAFGKSKLDLSLSNVPEFRSKEVLLQPTKSDLTLGNTKAKVQVVVFDSYSCVHCARFYEEIFPDLNRDYIATNKISFVHKSFPLDKRALFATKVVNCSSNKLAQIQYVYQNQDALIMGNSYEEQLLDLSGVNKTCVEKYDEEELTKEIFEYSKVLEIRGTPTILVNGKKVERFSKKNLISAIETELGK
ncbi:MAG: thioredoxin domain-containing protein [Proteobacteria bacterium]|nr:thioredoxin domain-containing protein [Pseudomonadota bacterium]